MQHCQNEWRWIIALFFFFLERELIIDTMFKMLELVFVFMQ